MQTTLIDEESCATVRDLHPAGQCTQASFGQWRVATCSTTGLRHLQQQRPCEDSSAYREHLHGAIAVALGDGVSGGAAGLDAAVGATGYCVATPSQEFCSHALDAAVQAAVASRTQAKGATTLVAAWLNAYGQGHLIHVGDCRIYHWRSIQGELKALTVDETFTTLGELPPRHISPDNPARMLGLGHGDTPKRRPIQLVARDLLLLCSDGLHGVVPDRELARLIARYQVAQITSARTKPSTLSRLARRLVRSALARGSDDDVSVLLLGFVGTSI